ncbi:MAG: hypothetical protein MK103_06415 [Planctomycetes bacterium]|nr:hypothetical protein [Planctomycetota bacterium]
MTTADKSNRLTPQTLFLISWLIPGMGHICQGRTQKGLLFLVLLWGSFFYGMYLGEWQVVYFRFGNGETRFSYFAQIGIGAAALPGLVQGWRAEKEQGPFPLFGRFQFPPEKKELDELHNRLGRWLDLGTLYTMVAGLLNILVVFDALWGPASLKIEMLD